MARSPILVTMACASILVTQTAFAAKLKIHNPLLQAPSAAYPLEPALPLPESPEWHLVRKGEQIELFAKDCTTLGQLLGTLSEWRIRHGEPSAKPALSEDNGYCKASIRALLPSFVAERIHSHPAWHGPNSWNAVLVESGLVNSWRVSDDVELQYYLKSPACQLLAPLEKPQLGDIGIIKTHLPDRPLTIAHAFTYLSPEMVFTKDDSDFTSPWALQSPSFALSLFGLDQSAARCRDTRNDNNDGCDKTLQYYRCQNLESASRMLGWTPLPEIQALMTRIQTLDARVSRLTLGQEPFTEAAAEEVLNEHTKLFDESFALETKVTEQVGADEAAWFFLGVNHYRLVSLAYQISGFFINQTVQEEASYWYRHEPWSGITLTPLAPGQTSVIKAWLTCKPGAPCERPEGLKPLPPPTTGGYLKH